MKRLQPKKHPSSVGKFETKITNLPPKRQQEKCIKKGGCDLLQAITKVEKENENF